LEETAPLADWLFWGTPCVEVPGHIHMTDRTALTLGRPRTQRCRDRI
jgi:hypothetical protein